MGSWLHLIVDPKKTIIFFLFAYPWEWSFSPTYKRLQTNSLLLQHCYSWFLFISYYQFQSHSLPVVYYYENRQSCIIDSTIWSLASKALLPDSVTEVHKAICTTSWWMEMLTHAAFKYCSRIMKLFSHLVKNLNNCNINTTFCNWENMNCSNIPEGENVIYFLILLHLHFLSIRK